MLRERALVSHSQEVKRGEQVVLEEGGERGGETKPWAVRAPGTAIGDNFSLTFQLHWSCLQGYELGQQNDKRLRARLGLEQVRPRLVSHLCP